MCCIDIGKEFHYLNLKISFLVVFLLFSTLQYNSHYQKSALSVGDSFIYEIIESDFYIEIGSEVRSRNGYLFVSQVHPLGTRINATVEDVDIGDADYRFWVDGNDTVTSVAHISSHWLDVFGVDLSYRTLYYVCLAAENINALFWLDLAYFRIHPYFDLVFNDYLHSPDTLGEDIHYFFGRWFYLYPNIECLYDYSLENGIIHFESWVGGKIDAPFRSIIDAGTNLPTDISFGDSYQFSVDNETGVVVGWGQRGWVKGKINGTSVKASMELHYELEGYDSPPYQLGEMKEFSEGNPDLVFYIVLSVLAVTVPIIVYILRKKSIKNI